MPQVSFGASIKPLFLNIDISQTKSFGVNLGDYMTNPDNTNGVLATLAPQNGKPPTMAQAPYGIEPQIALFEQWQKDGFQR